MEVLEEPIVQVAGDETMKVQRPRKGWGKILVGVRLEKMVEATFFRVWTELLLQGLREGDGYIIAEGMVAHRAANYLARELLKTDYDSLFFIDSDCDIPPSFLDRFRDYELGWEYDVLQAFYTRRGWPPDAIWVQENSYGNLNRCIVLDPDYVDDVALVGLHALLIRREVFEKMRGEDENELYEWFYYPRHTGQTEDAAWSFDARDHGFKLGATTHVKSGHIVHVTSGWETYQDWLFTSGSMERIRVYNELLPVISEFTGETQDDILSKAAQGSKNVNASWEKALPKTPEESRKFYGDYDNGYLYDLFAWNTSIPYMRLVLGLKEYMGNEVLVIGAGLGVEIDFLKKDNSVSYFELPGILSDFLKVRFDENGGNIEQVPAFEFGELRNYDDLENKFNVIVMIDVLEHVHPKEVSAILNTVDWLLSPGGTVYLHNNFGDQEIYPMHYDHTDVFENWCNELKLILESSVTWRKPQGV